MSQSLATELPNLAVAPLHGEYFQVLGELNDIGVKVDLPLKFESFNSFLDFFFDNLISDWIAQRKIKATLDNIHSVADICSELNADLHTELDVIKTDLNQLEIDRDHILENN